MFRPKLGSKQIHELFIGFYFTYVSNVFIGHLINQVLIVAFICNVVEKMGVSIPFLQAGHLR